MIEQVDDELEFVHAFKVSHFRLIARFDQRFKACLNKFTDSTAQDNLLAEQIGLGLFRDGGFDNTASGSANPLGIGEAQLLRQFCCSRPECDEAGNSASFGILTAYQVAWAFGGNQECVDTLRRFDLPEMDIESMRAHQNIARHQVRFDVRFVKVPLDFVRQE